MLIHLNTHAMTQTSKKILSQYSNVVPIVRKELRSYFNSAVAYVVIVVFLGIIGWFFTNNVFLMNVASLRMMFEIVPAVFLFFIPAITMRLLSEEKKSGTIELLTTKPISDTEIVLGKFLAAWALVCIALVPTLLYYVTLAFLGSIDSGPVVGGYVGLILMAGVYVAIGVFASSLTDNQVVAFILGFVFVFAIFMLDKILFYVPEWMTTTVEFLGIDFHFSSIARGVIDSRDIIYFFSMLGMSLMLAVGSLQRRNW